MKQWQHIFLKYLRNEHIVVVLRCFPSEEVVGLAILKKNSEGRSRSMGPGPTSPSDFFLEMADCPASSLIPSLNHTNKIAPSKDFKTWHPFINEIFEFENSK